MILLLLLLVFAPACFAEDLPDRATLEAQRQALKWQEALLYSNLERSQLLEQNARLLLPQVQQKQREIDKALQPPPEKKP
jgi:hypothetical protein